MRVLLFISFCVCGVFAQNHQLTQIMQDMEWAMDRMERGFLYNRKELINEGLKDFKALNKKLLHIDPNTYLGPQRRRDINVVTGVLNRNQENIEAMEQFLKRDEFIESAGAYGRILRGCMSCHIVSRGW